MFKAIFDRLHFVSRNCFIQFLLVQHRIRWFRFQALNLRRKPTTESFVVSLTSTPPRFAYLSETLKTILMQSMRPSRITVYLENRHYSALTKELQNMQKYGITFSKTDLEVRAANKLLPELLRAEGEEFIIYLDDDIIYPKHLFRSMFETYFKLEEKVFVINWANCFPVNKNTGTSTYKEWVSIRDPGLVSKRLVPLGVGGVLIKRSLIPKSILQIENLVRTTLTNDDFWYFVNLLPEETPFALNIRRQRIPICWPGSQVNALWHENVKKGMNDENIRRLQMRYPERFSRFFWLN